jgi:hypothetical protein
MLNVSAEAGLKNSERRSRKIAASPASKEGPFTFPPAAITAGIPATKKGATHASRKTWY